MRLAVANSKARTTSAPLSSGICPLSRLSLPFDMGRRRSRGCRENIVLPGNWCPGVCELRADQLALAYAGRRRGWRTRSRRQLLLETALSRSSVSLDCGAEAEAQLRLQSHERLQLLFRPEERAQESASAFHRNKTRVDHRASKPRQTSSQLVSVFSVLSSFYLDHFCHQVIDGIGASPTSGSQGIAWSNCLREQQVLFV